MVDDPLTHFALTTTSVFLAFYLLSIMPDYTIAVWLWRGPW